MNELDFFGFKNRKLTMVEKDIINENWLVHVVHKKVFNIPIVVKIVSFSFFLFMLGRGLGADTYFSIYIKSIVDNLFLVSVIWAGLAFIKMLFSLPIGKLDDHTNLKSMIFFWKFLYMIAWIFYFLAWMLNSVYLLVAAVVFNGLAMPAVLNTYQTYIRLYVQNGNRRKWFWLYFSSANLALVIWALVASLFIEKIQLPYVYLFIVLFAAISLFTDNVLPKLNRQKISEIVWKESFLHQFFREVFSFSNFKEIFFSMRELPIKVYKSLSFEFIFNVIGYIWYIFIPIISIKENLWLAQIAILFAVMRLPYLINLFSLDFLDNYDKKKIIFFVLMFMSFMYLILWSCANVFVDILIVCFFIALWLAVIRPIISGLISEHVIKKETWTITWVAEFIGRLWEVLWALWFGVLSSCIWLGKSFVIVGVCLLIFSSIWLLKRIFSRN